MPADNPVDDTCNDSQGGDVMPMPPQPNAHPVSHFQNHDLDRENDDGGVLPGMWGDVGFLADMGGSEERTTRILRGEYSESLPQAIL